MTALPNATSTAGDESMQQGKTFWIETWVLNYEKYRAGHSSYSTHAKQLFP